MEINNKIFNVVLVLVATLVAAGYGLIFYLKLDGPVFFHHYYDQRIYVDREHYQDISFNLGYITDAYDDRVVIDIEFPEYPELTIQASEYGYIHPFNWGFEHNDTPGDIYGRYSVRSVYCKIIDLPEGKDLDGVVLTQARIMFDDSSEMAVDIGEIHLYEHMTGESLLEHISSSGSSDGTGKTTYRILGDLTITLIESPLMEKFKDRVQWKVNGTNPHVTVGMTLQEGNFLDVTSKVGVADDIVSEYTLFDIHPKLTFTDDHGIHYSQRFYNINSIYHNYSFTNLYRYIKARGTI
ncbi:hypothetical protein [Natronincola ferrireducens]|uniref:Uncharacterized protein n=1 Tax=Natronincola ferrireducens TaxID=393762 RepID=A0A1G9GHG1_9FIRM|nr:hypothetical protein [Natronincola ferrireducens]SDL00032.1 hypothetical protein SAMN05660472_02420 [Natronincola ferrireducens]